jgi:CheY-like chemotaxis protein
VDRSAAARHQHARDERRGDAATLRADETRNLAVIVVSTEGSETRLHALQELGAAIVHKPFPPETLRDTILRVTGVTDVEYYGSSPAQATASTFEELALLFLEPECTEEQAAAPLDAGLVWTFTARCMGRLVVRASQCTLPGDRRQHARVKSRRSSVPLQRDALGEVANVICGNVLPLIAGADKIFNSMPRSG